jgi:hypothetical protein
VDEHPDSINDGAFSMPNETSNGSTCRAINTTACGFGRRAFRNSKVAVNRAEYKLTFQDLGRQSV